MTTLQTTAIITLAAAAACRILFFDKRHRTHKPIISLIAWLMYIWLASLIITVVFQLHHLTEWGLIFSLALHTGAILWHKGNISNIYPNTQKDPK